MMDLDGIPESVDRVLIVPDLRVDLFTLRFELLRQFRILLLDVRNIPHAFNGHIIFYTDFFLDV